MPMSNEKALAALGQYLHQDIDLDAHTPAELVSNALRMMTPQDRQALGAYLSNALERYSPSELKGQLNRANENWSFTSKGAAQFLHIVGEQLSMVR